MRSRLDRAFRLSIALGCLLAASGAVAGSTTSRHAAMSRLDSQLRAEADRERNDLEESFERARSILLIAAQNPAFADLYAPGATSEERVASGGTQVGRVNDALTFLEDLFPERIGEACFIDLGGAENARVVRGRTAAVDELSPDESSNSFFAPTAALAPGEVYHAAPYVSPDTGEWVISNSTPIITPDGRSRGMLHFEVTVESFRRELRSASHESVIVDATSGAVVATDGRAQRTGTALGQPTDDRFVGITATDRPATVTVDGRRFAVVSLARGPANANHWMVAVGDVEPLGWLVGFGFAEMAVTLVGVLIAAVGVYARRSHHARLRDALVDDLTGLPSRRQLLDARLEPGPEPGSGEGAVLMIDLDRFKEVNDTLGHRHGDALLTMVAERLRAAIPPGAMLARLGGDEFAIVLAGPHHPERVVELGTAIAEAIAETFDLDGLPVQVGASVGIALAPRHGTTIHDLVQHADIAMYDAKHRSLGVAVYDPRNDPHSPERLTLAAELRTAIRNGDVDLHYQPKVDLITGRTMGLEGLARWTAADGRRVAPDEFIPLAERSGLMIPLTRLVLDTGLDQLATWRAMGLDISLALNISPSSLLDRGFVGDVSAALRRHGTPPHALVLELTETTVMDDPARSLRVLEELRRIGVRLSIDDFGTGYSSLGYLQRLPVGELKIDRSFLTQLSDVSDLAIVRATIELGHSLGLSVVAEGVEEQTTLDQLHALGCDLAQGYLLSRPADAATMTEWLLAHPVPLIEAPTQTLPDHLIAAFGELSPSLAAPDPPTAGGVS